MLFPAGQSLAVFPAEIVLPALRQKLVQMGAANGHVKLLLRKVTEHGHVIPDGSVEYKHILLDVGDHLIERFGGNASQLRIVEENIALVIRAARHQQMEQRGFPAAAAAYDGIRLSRLKDGGNIVQNIFSFLIAEGNLLQTDTFFQPGNIGAPRGGRILLQCRGQLVDQAAGRLAAGQQTRQLRNGLDHKIHQVHEHNHGAGRQSAS